MPRKYDDLPGPYKDLPPYNPNPNPDPGLPDKMNPLMGFAGVWPSVLLLSGAGALIAYTVTGHSLDALFPPLL
eukprot:g485.t1